MPVLGPIAVVGTLDLDGVQFASPVRIEADASALICCRGRFPGGVRFDVSRALVRLDDTDLSVPSLLTVPASGPAGITGQPRLLSLQRANVAGLAVGNVDLADCRFGGAHNLDKLRLEAGSVFGLSPAVAAGSNARLLPRNLRGGQDPMPGLAAGNLRNGSITKMSRRSWARAQSLTCTGRCARAVRTPKTNPAPPTSTTARWRCAATIGGRITPMAGGPGAWSLVVC